MPNISTILHDIKRLEINRYQVQRSIPSPGQTKDFLVTNLTFTLANDEVFEIRAFEVNGSTVFTEQPGSIPLVWGE
jgi:hypothetical protein